MNNKDRDYIFNINWQDIRKNSYKVGLLAQIDKIFYFIMSSPKNAEFAYKNGFAGIPGFHPDTIYKSQELFDFFKSRISNDKNESPCEELAKTKGRSMTDSFSVEEVSERFSQKYREIILHAYEVQAKTEQLKIAKQGENGKSSDTSQIGQL